VSRRSPAATNEAAAVAFLAAVNVTLNHVAPAPLAVPAALAAAAAAVLLGVRAGAGVRAQGLSPDTVASGTRVGLAAAVPITLLVGLGALFPPTRRFFRDDRVTQATPAQAAYELFVRIPIATAASEEVMFRSALEGILARNRSPLRAALISAPLFGIWHVLPALDRLHSNPGLSLVHRGGIKRRAAVVACTIGITATASLGFSWLRRRTGSVVAPILVHYGINAGGFAGGWIASRGERTSE
jgi:tRNA pseudouridine32 synthase/23S rRNA pseudouridine746 synthase